MVIVVVMTASPWSGRVQLTVSREPLRNVADPRQVQRTWPDVQFFENRIGSLVIVRLVDTARMIIQVTEYDGTGWTSILACRSDVSVVNLAITLGS